ncbi:MAG: ankyrin repeat domain-containing protein [Planctomycetota bacterium]
MYVRRRLAYLGPALLAALGAVSLLSVWSVARPEWAFSAARRGKTRRLAWSLALRPSLAQRFGPQGTLLHVAAANGREGVAGWLLQRGADPNRRRSDGLTALHLALKGGHAPAARVLLRSGADPNAPAGHGGETRCLDLARTAAMARLLLEHGAELGPSEPWPSRATTDLEFLAALLGGLPGASAVVLDRHASLLEKAIGEGYAGEVRGLLSRPGAGRAQELVRVVRLALETDDCPELAALGLDLCRGISPSDLAALRGPVLEHGTAVHLARLLALLPTADPADLAPLLRTAVRNGHHELARDALWRYLPINSRSRRGKDGPTLLHMAVRSADVDLARAILASGGSVNVTDETGATPLDLAVRLHPRNAEMIELLLVHRAYGELGNVYAALERWRAAGKTQQVRAYVTALDPVDRYRDRLGYTLLHLAVSSGNIPMAKLALELGASPDTQSWTGLRPLHLAVTARAHARELTALLLDRGANPDGEDLYNRTPLHRAAMTGAEPPVMKLLLEGGGDTTARCIDGYTPLLRAAEANDMELVQTLLDLGANINETDKNRQAAIHYAARLGYLDLAKELLRRDCYFRQKDNGGARPIRHAIRQGHREIVDLLIEAHEERKRRMREEAKKRQKAEEEK